MPKVRKRFGLSVYGFAAQFTIEMAQLLRRRDGALC
jgi:hypothetical protein